MEQQSKKQDILLVALIMWVVGIFAVVFTAAVRAWFIAPYLVFLVVVGPITFWMYGVDKRQAQAGEWRTPENVLHAFELCGGWVGALFAQYYYRHKVRKQSYLIVFWLIVALHGALIVLLMSPAARSVAMAFLSG